LIPWLTDDLPFPPVERALKSPNGLLAAGGELSAPRLLEAYRNGIFPWFNPGEPILWWSPDLRMVLIPGELIVSRSLSKVLRNSPFELRCDTVFEQVMRGCAAPRTKNPVGQPGGTWIGEDMINAYCLLHSLGYAHSVETWLEGKLVGGLYGVSIGRMFYGESMFSGVSNASKIALAHLARQLERWKFGMIDCQMSTPHLVSLGAREIPRSEFIASLQELIHYEPVTDWKFDFDLFT
jgi:leucyl/phenylalanyl-tRNA---protein transferase